MSCSRALWAIVSRSHSRPRVPASSRTSVTRALLGSEDAAEETTPKPREPEHTAGYRRESPRLPALSLGRTEPGPEQTMEQVWFAGVHSDVGGYHPERGLANISLHWMLGKAAAAGLEINRRRTGDRATSRIRMARRKSRTPGSGGPGASTSDTFPTDRRFTAASGTGERMPRTPITLRTFRTGILCGPSSRGSS